MSDTVHPGSRSETVRQSNLTAILRTLHVGTASTRSDLVAATGLTRSAVGTLVGELVEMGYVHEERAAPDGSPGRPSPIVHPSPTNVVIAMEVLVDFVAVAAVALGGEVLDVRRVDRRRTDMHVDDTVDDLVELATQILDGLTDAAIVHGVGVAVAGVVRRADGRLVVAPNIGWHDIALGELIGDALPLDVPVVVGNDGDLGALAVSRRGVAAGLRNVVYISGEVGVGAGVIVDGRPMRGAAGYAGEVGHMPINLDGRPCKCGSTGCWETEVGEEALLRRSGRPTDGGRAALDEVLEAAAMGDQAILEAMADHGRWLGIGLAGVINLFDPEVIVLGGMFARVHPYVSTALDAELDRRVFDAIREQVDVVPSTCGVGSPLLGAAERAWEPVLNDPAAASRRRTSTTTP